MDKLQQVDGDDGRQEPGHPELERAQSQARERAPGLRGIEWLMPMDTCNRCSSWRVTRIIAKRHMASRQFCARGHAVVQKGGVRWAAAEPRLRQ
jgi:hypothetical protein